jgi:hypothetical protein
MVAQSTRFDNAVFDVDKQLQLVVEATLRPRATADWAREYHRNLRSFDILPTARYFAFALPERIFLWDRNGEPADDGDDPTYVVDARPIFGPYARRFGYSLETLNSVAFALIVTTWLEDLVRTTLSPESADPSLGWLFESGLYEAIKDGSVMAEVAA